MPRPRSRPRQLDLQWADTMQWEDVPRDAQERVRELLAELLRHAAQHADGVGDE